MAYTTSTGYLVFDAGDTVMRAATLPEANALAEALAGAPAPYNYADIVQTTRVTRTP